MVQWTHLLKMVIAALLLAAFHGISLAASCPPGLYEVNEFETTPPPLPANGPKKIQVTIDGQERIAAPEAAEQLLQALVQLRKDGEIGNVPRSNCTNFSVRVVGTWGTRASWVYEPASKRMSSYIYGESIGLQGVKFSTLSDAQYADLRRLASAVTAATATPTKAQIYVNGQPRVTSPALLQELEDTLGSLSRSKLQDFESCGVPDGVLLSGEERRKARQDYASNFTILRIKKIEYQIYPDVITSVDWPTTDIERDHKDKKNGSMPGHMAYPTAQQSQAIQLLLAATVIGQLPPLQYGLTPRQRAGMPGLRGTTP